MSGSASVPAGNDGAAGGSGSAGGSGPGVKGGRNALRSKEVLDVSAWSKFVEARRDSSRLT